MIQEFEDDDDLEIIDFILNGIPRQIYERKSYFHEYDEIGFRKRFRLNKQCVLSVLQLIEHHLEYPYDKNNCVSPIDQLLTCLRLYSTGGHLLTIADYTGMHVSTVSRIVVRVSEAIASLYPRFVKFPNTEEERARTQVEFYRKARFPKVIGAIDGTHIKCCPNGNDREIFRNRKGYFSINCQTICTADLKITDIVARWPGSSHDATIFNNSRVHTKFEEGMYRNCVLLGDAGYPCKTYLLTPLLNPRTPEEQLYNESHIRTRNPIERLFGVLKRRFPILAYGCRLKISTTLTIIVATAVLHNMAVDLGEHEPPPVPDEIVEEELDRLIANGQIPHIDYVPNEPVGIGAHMRRQFINTYFSNL